MASLLNTSFRCRIIDFQLSRLLRIPRDRDPPPFCKRRSTRHGWDRLPLPLLPALGDRVEYLLLRSVVASDFSFCVGEEQEKSFSCAMGTYALCCDFLVIMLGILRSSTILTKTEATLALSLFRKLYSRQVSLYFKSSYSFHFVFTSEEAKVGAIVVTRDSQSYYIQPCSVGNLKRFENWRFRM